MNLDEAKFILFSEARKTKQVVQGRLIAMFLFVINILVFVLREPSEHHVKNLVKKSFISDSCRSLEAGKQLIPAVLSPLHDSRPKFRSK